MLYYPLVVLMVFINCFSDSQPVASDGTIKQNVLLMYTINIK